MSTSMEDLVPSQFWNEAKPGACSESIAPVLADFHEAMLSDDMIRIGECKSIVIAALETTCKDGIDEIVESNSKRSIKFVGVARILLMKTLASLPRTHTEVIFHKQLAVFFGVTGSKEILRMEKSPSGFKAERMLSTLRDCYSGHRQSNSMMLLDNVVCSSESSTNTGASRIDISMTNAEQDVMVSRNQAVRGYDTVKTQPSPGMDDFVKIRKSGSAYVDKSLLVKRFIENLSEVDLVLRPRRFGKTVNLSFLEFFLSDSIDPSFRNKLLDGLEISKDRQFCEQHAGKYKVIRFSFKGLSHYDSWPIMFRCIVSSIWVAISAHKEVVPLIRGGEKFATSENYNPESIDGNLLVDALFDLIRLSDKEVILLIDEYETPLVSRLRTDADELARTSWFSRLYNQLLNGCPNLKKALLNGVVGIQGCRGFSGIDNISYYGVNDKIYDKFYGFTKSEVLQLLQDTSSINLEMATAVWDRPRGLGKLFYCYRMGNHQMVNPWSCSRYIQYGVIDENYPSDTASTEDLFETLSNNAVIRDQFIMSLREILDTKSVDAIPIGALNPRVPIKSTERWSRDQLFHYLCLTGHLTYEPLNQISGKVRIPNEEVYDEFVSVLARLNGFGGIAELISYYKRIIDAFVEFDVDKIMLAIEHDMGRLSNREIYKEHAHQILIASLIQAINITQEWTVRLRDIGTYFESIFEYRFRCVILSFNKETGYLRAFTRVLDISAENKPTENNYQNA